MTVERGPLDDLVEALVGLGYRAKEAEAAARAALAGDSDISLAEGLRSALRKLSRV